MDSTPILKDAVALNARAAEDGYLFFKRLLPPEAVLGIRREMLAVLQKYGWRVAGQDELGGQLDLDAVKAVADEDMRSDIGVPTAVYHDVQRLERLHRLPHHPTLMRLYQTLFGREVLVHARHIARMICPHRTVFPTPPHQDFPLIQGTANTWTCWIPMGDCPTALGGLAVLRGSHRNGYIPVQQSKGAGSIAVQLCPGEVEWLTTSYDAGDVLTFPSFTVHRGLRSEFKDRVRLSLDVRFQPADEVIEPGSLAPHCDLTWEDIYSQWASDELKYYWRKLPLKFIDKDPSYRQPKRRIC